MPLSILSYGSCIIWESCIGMGLDYIGGNQYVEFHLFCDTANQFQ